MTHDLTNSHLSAETMQAFLEGELSRRETSATEEHLASCPRCSAELDGWRVLFEDLGGRGFSYDPRYSVGSVVLFRKVERDETLRPYAGA